MQYLQINVNVHSMLYIFVRIDTGIACIRNLINEWMHESVTENEGNLCFLKVIHKPMSKAAGNQIEKVYG